MAGTNIYLTLDYELFFGNTPGSIEKCMLEPTRALMAISERTGALMTYFVDAGYLFKLNSLRNVHPQLEEDYRQVTEQLKQLIAKGNDCQLHIHPHWEDALFDNGQWIFNVDRYKLSDFTIPEINDIFLRYSEALRAVTGSEIHSYRAGGWCLQPFNKVMEAFKTTGIVQDSTVFPGGKNINEVYYYDFTSVQSNHTYRFESELCVPDKDGSFLELPIAAHTYSPLFFWQLYGWGRIIPKRHKPIGDGFPISTKGERGKRLTKKSRLPVSLDGYFARSLSQALKKNQADDFVVIGHPKACTLFSLEQLEKFILKQRDKHSFQTFSDRLKT